MSWRCSPLRFVSLILIASSFIVAGSFQLSPPVARLRGRCIVVDRICPGRTDVALASKTSKTDGDDKGNGSTDQQHSEDTHNIQNEDILGSINHNATKDASNNENTSKDNNATTVAKSWNMPLSLKHRSEAPIFLFPWSLWMKIRSSIPMPGIMHDKMDSSRSQSKSNINPKQKPKRRWEIPLTSKPYQGVEDLESTILACIVAIALYFFIGMLAFPLWLEPSWTLVDAVYFSMVSLTTVGYGDVVVGSGGGTRAILAKLFVLSFNVYAVCISVSALGIIAKLALNQEHKIISKAKEKARQRLVQMFDSEEDDEIDLEEEEDAADEDDEQCQWADRVFGEKDECALPEEPRSIFGTLAKALRSNSSDFVAVALIGWLIKRAERWSFIDLLYYWNCTATTIGFGDVCPQTQRGRLFAIVFIPLSVVTLGEVIASVFSFVSSRIAAKAEKDFIRREITLSDLEYLDVNDDGKVCELDFITFMLVAMHKVDQRTIKDLLRLFHALDAGKDGFIQKEDLITLRQRKRFSKRLKRDRRKTERWFETKMTRESKRKKKKWFGQSY